MAVMRQHFWRLFDTDFCIGFCTVRCSPYSPKESEPTKELTKKANQKIIWWFLRLAESKISQRTATKRTAGYEAVGINVKRAFLFTSSYQTLHICKIRVKFAGNFLFYDSSDVCSSSIQLWSFLEPKMFLHTQRKRVLRKICLGKHIFTTGYTKSGSGSKRPENRRSKAYFVCC